MMETEDFYRSEEKQSSLDRIGQTSYAGYKLTYSGELTPHQRKSLINFIQDIPVGFALMLRTDHDQSLRTRGVLKHTLPEIQAILQRNVYLKIHTILSAFLYQHATLSLIISARMAILPGHSTVSARFV